MSKWLLKLLPLIMKALSGPIRAELVNFAKGFRVKAKATDNPWDDFVADILCWLLMIE